MKILLVLAIALLICTQIRMLNSFYRDQRRRKEKNKEEAKKLQTKKELLKNKEPKTRINPSTGYKEFYYS